MTKLKILLIAACTMFITAVEARHFFICDSGGQGWTVVADASGRLCCWQPAGGCPANAPFAFEINCEDFGNLSDDETDDDVTMHIATNLDVFGAPPPPAIIDELTLQLETALNSATGVPLIYVAGNELSPEQYSYLTN